MCHMLHMLTVLLHPKDKVQRTPVRPGKGVKRKYQSPATPSGKPTGTVLCVQCTCKHGVHMCKPFGLLNMLREREVLLLWYVLKRRKRSKLTLSWAYYMYTIL